MTLRPRQAQRNAAERTGTPWKYIKTELWKREETYLTQPFQSNVKLSMTMIPANASNAINREWYCIHCQDCVYVVWNLRVALPWQCIVLLSSTRENDIQRLRIKNVYGIIPCYNHRGSPQSLFSPKGWCSRRDSVCKCPEQRSKTKAARTVELKRMTSYRPNPRTQGTWKISPPM